MRRAVLLSVSGLLVLSLMPLANAQPPSVRDEIEGYAILPPGHDQSFAHVADQHAMYGALVDDDDITTPELADYFHDFSFTPMDIDREYQPPGRTDVTIFRDGFNIPHVYADSDEAAAYALGYATAEDRLWQADVLRHAGRGSLSGFLGSDYTTFDRTTRRDSYTEGQLEKMLARLDDRHGDLGALLQSSLSAYADGMNARIDEIQAGTVNAPLEYVAQGLPVEDWTETDSLAAAVVQIRSFGGGGGKEADNAAGLRALQDRLGNDLGAAVFDDIFYRNDPFAYPSVPESAGTFPSPDLGAVDPKAVAIPDDPAKVVAQIAAGRRASERTLERLGLKAPASNFVSIAPSGSTTGAPLQWGGPQVGYSVPAPFMEIAVHSPSGDGRGMTLPGFALFPAIGRTADHAWSITTGAGDVVDTYVEKLCHPKKRPVPKRSKFYRYKGDCKKMRRRVEEFDVRGAPDFSKKFFRTKHGPVVAWNKVNGKPVAITQKRSYWMRETDFIAALAGVNLETDSVEDFSAAMSGAPMSFNITYADAQDIAYLYVGRYPIRKAGVDPRLPTWGTGKWEWEGSVSWEDHPNMVNPEQGFVTSWNNKPSAGWDSSDHSNWGPTQRVRLLSDQLEDRLSGGGTLTLADLAEVMAQAATQDANAVRLWDRVSGSLAADPGVEQDALDALETWVGAGSHREDVNRDEITDSAAAVAVWDTMYAKLVHAIFDDELGDTIATRIKVADDPAHNNGSSYFFDFSNYVWHLFGGDTSGWARDYCDVYGGAEKTCDELVQQAFDAAVAELAADKGNDVTTWTWPADQIRFSALGANQVDPLPWQNRGTYNHLVELVGP